MRVRTAFAVVLACSVGAAAHARERVALADLAVKDAQTFAIATISDKSDPGFFKRAALIASKQLIDKGYRPAAPGSVPDVVVKLNYSAKLLRSRTKQRRTLTAPTDLQYSTGYSYETTSQTAQRLAILGGGFAVASSAIFDLYQLKLEVEMSRSDGARLFGDSGEQRMVDRGMRNARRLINATLKDLPVAS